MHQKPRLLKDIGILQHTRNVFPPLLPSRCEFYISCTLNLTLPPTPPFPEAMLLASRHKQRLARVYFYFCRIYEVNILFRNII